MSSPPPTITDAVELLEREADRLRWKHQCERDAGYRRKPRAAEAQRATVFEIIAAALRDLNAPADAPLADAIRRRT